MPRGITLTQIDYFLAVARYLNFTEAAKSLYMSQPAVSKQIQALEEQLGVPLFERSTHRVRLSPAGEVLLKELENVNHTIENALNLACEAGAETRGTIRIGLFDLLGTEDYMRDFLGSFATDHPNISVMLERRSVKRLREKLITDLYDMIVTQSFEIEGVPGVHTVKMSHVPLSIAISMDDELSKKDNLKLIDLKDHGFIMISRTESTRGHDVTQRICERHGFKPKLAKLVPNFESSLFAVSAGQGVAIVDSRFILREGTRIRLIPLIDEYLDVAAAWKEDNSNPLLPELTSALSEFLKTRQP